jgi:hypothetical protein
MLYGVISSLVVERAILVFHPCGHLVAVLVFITLALYPVKSIKKSKPIFYLVLYSSSSITAIYSLISILQFTSLSLNSSQIHVLVDPISPDLIRGLINGIRALILGPKFYHHM